MRIFDAGETVVWRTVIDGRVRTAFPNRCLAHDHERIVLWRPAGTVYKRPSGPYGAGPRGRSLDVARWDGTYRDLVWTGDGILLFHRFGDRHTVFRFPDSWYVNLERPWEPNPVGFDSRDLILDVVVDTDGWRFKDVDEFDHALAAGRLDPADVGGLRDYASDVAERAALREPPFDDAWDDWEPDTSWAPPALPDGWDEP